MQVNITFRGFDPSDALKSYAKEKVERANKYLDKAGEAHIVLSLERHLQNADITIHSGKFVLRGREKTEDMYASLDLAMDKIERQLRRYKERIKHHHGRDLVHHGERAARKFRHDVVAVTEPESAPEPQSPRVVRTNDFLTRAMSVDEAIMQMDLMNNDFYVFTSAENHEMCVVYRRKDGHYGLIEAHSVKEQA